MKKITIYSIGLVVLGICVALWAMRGLTDFDLSRHHSKEVIFNAGDAVLSGTLVMPMHTQPKAIAILIHGDGPQDRFSGDGYLPLINTLVDAGIGVFTWDKAGIGASTGNWLHQTMDDRAHAAIAARRALAAEENIDIENVGYIGFSQAGWVLPRVASRSDPAFTMIVGGAVSWRDQGSYYSRTAMTLAGVDQDVITRHLIERSDRYDALFRGPKTIPPPGMEADRFRFVKNAYWEDSTDLIAKMKNPVLAVWGQDDLNVDARRNAAVFRTRLSPLADDRRVIVIPDATHGLLRSDIFNYQLAEDWPWYAQLLFLRMGRRAYAKGSLDRMADWIVNVTVGSP